MKERARGFRRSVERQNGARAVRRRFGAALRADAVSYSRDRRGQGASWSMVSKELAVSTSLLQKWCWSAREGFARVEIVEEASSTSVGMGQLRLTTPQGHEVEGLTVSEAAELLRLLS